ncbi:MAG: hypothetical protein OXN83_06315, partial [Oligoflexia bacterium]|nr:hypothetical protein [Oligoflexia bacterium]
YYDPDLARWISEDPIEFNGGDLNLYRYTFNSSINYTDPSGEAYIQIGVAYITYTTICNIIKIKDLAKATNKAFLNQINRTRKKIKQLEKQLKMCKSDKEEDKIEARIFKLEEQLSKGFNDTIKKQIKESVINNFTINPACAFALTII